MRKYLTLILIIYSTGGWAQVSDSLHPSPFFYYKKDSSYVIYLDTLAIIGTPNGAYQKPIRIRWHRDSKFIEISEIDTIPSGHLNNIKPKRHSLMPIDGHPKPVIVQTYPRLTGIQGDPPQMTAGKFVYIPMMGNPFNPYGFNTTDLMNKSISSFLMAQDTLKPQVFYGIAGIKKQPIDSSKYFYRRFLKLKSQGVPDSLNKFKSKLYKK